MHAVRTGASAAALAPWAETVIPGVWRLRLPLPWPELPHANAWVLARGAGVVLVDTGLHGPGSMRALEDALGLAGLALGDVRQLVCTHAHPDHCGQAAAIFARTGCEVLMHARHAHLSARLTSTGARLRRELARRSGVPDELLRQAHPASAGGVVAPVLPDRELEDGVEISTDAGSWEVIETPGHAPSHVCLFEPSRGLLLCGDHVLERPALHFDYGFTPDPVAEYLDSLGRVAGREVRLALPGHGRAFGEVPDAIARLHGEVVRRTELVAARVAQGRPSAFEIVAEIAGPALPTRGEHLLEETLAHLRHLELRGRVRPVRDGAVRRWASV